MRLQLNNLSDIITDGTPAMFFKHEGVVKIRPPNSVVLQCLIVIALFMRGVYFPFPQKETCYESGRLNGELHPVELVEYPSVP